MNIKIRFDIIIYRYIYIVQYLIYIYLYYIIPGTVQYVYSIIDVVRLWVFLNLDVYYRDEIVGVSDNTRVL